MAAITFPSRPTARLLPGWAVLAVAAALALLWLVSFEGGAVSQAIASSGSFLHELFHDGRHLLGVPCH